LREFLPAFAALVRLTAMTFFSGFGDFYKRGKFSRNFTRVRVGND
jgi:hypothetical protein